MTNPFTSFDELDTRLNQWLVRHSIRLLRISLGLVFLSFGLLKFFPGLSPIEDLAIQTTTALTFGLIAPAAGLVLVAALETTIGLCMLTGRFLRVAVWLMLAQLVGAMTPLLLFPGQLFTGPWFGPGLAAQYIIKDIVLVAAALVIASTWTGAHIVPETRSMMSTLRAGPPQVSRIERLESPRANVVDLTMTGTAHSEQESEALHVAATMLAAVSRHGESGRALVIETVPDAFPWVRSLTSADGQTFALELVDVLRAADSVGTLAPVVQLITEWQHTAEVHADPELAARVAVVDNDHGAVPEPFVQA